jgi:trans-2-enoyl-CoA reductase
VQKRLQRIFFQRTTRAHLPVYSGIIMEAMRNSWTDERLDDGFERVRSEIAVLRGEVGELRKELHQEVGSLRDEMHREMGSLRKELHGEIGSLSQEMHQQFAALNRTLLQVGGGVIVALIGVIVTQL